MSLISAQKQPKKFKVKEYKPEDGDGKFIVIYKPPANNGPDNRPYPWNDQNRYGLVVQWLQAVFHEIPDPVICVYAMTGYEEIIIELSDEVSLEPFLGLHRAQEFLTDNGNVSPGIRCGLFEYNFKLLGHPGKIKS